jgi:hypothetical protein
MLRKEFPFKIARIAFSYQIEYAKTAKFKWKLLQMLQNDASHLE